MSKKTPDFTDNLEESSLDEYGVWVKAGPEASIDLGDDSIVDLLDDPQADESRAIPESDLEMSIDDELSLQEPEPGSLPEAGITLKGQEVSDMSEQDKTKTASFAENLEEQDITLDSSDELALSNDDELGGLSDLLLNIDEETEQDETIYLEDDDLSFDLNEENEDLLLEQESLDSQSGDDFGEDIVIPGLDDELNIDDSENGLQIPQDSLEGLDDLDNELAALDDTLQVESSTAKANQDTIETHSVEEVGLDEFLSEQMDEEEVSIKSDDELSLDDDISFDITADSDLDMNNEITLDSEIESDISNDIAEDDLGKTIESSLDIDLGPEIDLNEDLADTELSFDTQSDDDHLPGVEQEIDSILNNTSETTGDLPVLDDVEIETSTGFDDVAAVTSDLTENQAPKAASSDKILTSIEEELHAIRSELTDLRAELKKLRSRDNAEVSMASDELDLPENDLEDNLDSSEEPKTTSGGGFFDDDDDETIALTGDELDNILNTAEFTEEAGEPTNPDLEEEMADTSLSGGVPVSAQEFTFSDADHESPTTSEPAAFEDAIESEQFEPIEEISLEDADLPKTEMTFDSEIDGLEEPSIESEQFQGSDHAVEQMAQMDIEKELAGIEDLKDEEEDIELYTGGELDSLELEIPEDFSDNNQVAIADETDELGEIQGFEEIDATEQPAPVSPAPISRNPEPLPKDEISLNLKQEIKAVLAYMDQLLESLPENKIEEFAKSEHFDVYKKLFDELGL